MRGMQVQEKVIMKNTRRSLSAFLAVMILAAITIFISPVRAAAQDEDQDQRPDPPSRVARLNFMQGSVSFQPGGEGDWLTAVPNRPLTTGDNLWADKESRAEVHVGSTALRLGSESSLTFLNLDDRVLQLRLAQGSLILVVRHLDDGETFEVDTPNLSFTPVRTGEYRIDVNSDGNQTVTTVWRGRGEATGGGNSYTVVAGQQARFSGNDQLNYDIEQISAPDAFSDWAFERDRREERSESANYISPEVTGSEDLDDYGRWRYVAGYGNVWAPNAVPEGWAPYRYGHWAWIAPWGWTWVEDEPWGFAPFHYGRWAYAPAGWFWVPGPVVVRPVYAPALVAFVGGPGGFVAVGGGPGVGWFPLAPGEVYVPPYRGSRTYINNVNITNTNVNVTKVTNVYNTTIINNNTTVNRVTYVNQRVPNAVTAVSHETFVNARPVSRNLVQVNAKEIAEAPVVHQAPVQPVKASVLGSGAPARFKPPATVVNRQVVANTAPAPPRPAFTAPAPAVRAQNPAPRAEPTTPVTQSRPVVEPGNIRPPQPNVGERTVARPPTAMQPEERTGNPRTAEPVENPRVQQTWSHPLAKPVPTVQEKSPQQAQMEEQKYHNWQQQYHGPAPRPSTPVPHPTAAPPHQEKPAQPHK
jgi:hypothetical protein